MREPGRSKTAVLEYPSADGKPMAETDLHWDWMVTIAQRLKRFFAGRRVYVASNLLIYFREGDPRKCVAPDAFLVKDCRPGRRETFLIWKEGRKPNAVVESTSKTTRREDMGKKKTVYAQLGVGEYFLYDPRGEWLKPPLQGFRLQDGAYGPIPPDAGGGIVSQELGIRLVLEGADLAMFDTATGERLLSQEEWREQETQRAEEAERRADAEKHRADAEAAARRTLEEELARLRDPGKKSNGTRRKNEK